MRLFYNLRDIPQALQIVWPLSSRRHNGVIVVPQFLQDSSPFPFDKTVDGSCGFMKGLLSPCNACVLASAFSSSFSPFSARFKAWLDCAFFESLLLYAGQPLQPSAPPVPLQRPPPGHDPPVVLCWTASMVLPVGIVPFDREGDVLCRSSVESDSEAGVDAVVIGARLRFIGRAVFLAFKYNPQALHMVEPVGDLRHSGVLEVPQLLNLDVSLIPNIK